VDLDVELDVDQVMNVAFVEPGSRRTVLPQAPATRIGGGAGGEDFLQSLPRTNSPPRNPPSGWIEEPEHPIGGAPSPRTWKSRGRLPGGVGDDGR